MSVARLLKGSAIEPKDEIAITDITINGGQWQKSGNAMSASVRAFRISGAVSDY